MNLIIISRAIYPLHGYGGMERHCYDWILSMAERNCTVNVITIPPENTSYPQFPNSVRFYFIPGFQARKVIDRVTRYPKWVDDVRTFLNEFLKTEGNDAVYANGLAAAACNGISIPMFYNPHGMEEFKTSGLKFLAYSEFRSMSRSSAKFATKIIATDKSLISEIQKYLKVSQEKIVLIPNSVRPEVPMDRSKCVKIRDKFQLDKADPIFLSVGRLELNKGFHVLLKALSQTKGLPPEWHLILAGSGSMADELKRTVSSSGIDKHVTFVGHISTEEMNCLYQWADLFIHPSLYEGSSIVTLEAMMNSLPVIATKIGGLPDKVRNDYNGWLIPPGDSMALSAAILHACEMKEKWKEMGKASQGIVAEQFTWDRAANLFLETFRQAK
jgi:glycosyltransferase involved in cell wall biosynthesis